MKAEVLKVALSVPFEEGFTPRTAVCSGMLGGCYQAKACGEWKRQQGVSYAESRGFQEIKHAEIMRQA